jgi:hypothetical protein
MTTNFRFGSLSMGDTSYTGVRFTEWTQTREIKVYINLEKIAINEWFEPAIHEVNKLYQCNVSSVQIFIIRFPGEKVLHDVGKFSSSLILKRKTSCQRTPRQMGYKQGLVFNEEKPNGIILNIANIY